MPQSCLETRPVLACFTDAAGVKQTVMQHIVYEGGQAVGQVYTLEDSTTPIDVSGGTVELGECAVFTPDVEWERQCDVQADGTVVEFMCQVVTSFDADGQVIVPSVTNLYELDKVTPYAPTGTVGDCAVECEVIGTVGLSLDWADFSAGAPVGPTTIVLATPANIEFADEALIEFLGGPTDAGQLAMESIFAQVGETNVASFVVTITSGNLLDENGVAVPSAIPFTFEAFFETGFGQGDLGGGIWSFSSLQLPQTVGGSNGIPSFGSTFTEFTVTAL